MTANNIPPTISPIQQLNNTIGQAAAMQTAALNNLVNKALTPLNNNLQKLNTYYNRSLANKTLGVIGGAIGASIPTLTVHNFRSMEELQKKAVMLGTNANKLSLLNTNEMKKLNTDSYTVLGERLDLLSDGFRDNNDNLVKLGVRMKVTGQDTELLHKTMTQMYTVAGLNNIEIGSLSKTIIDYAREFGVSNSRLLETLSQMTNVLSTANFAGLGKKFADVGAIMSAKLPMVSQVIPKFLEMMTDIKFAPTFQRLGLNMMDLSRSLDDNNESGEDTSNKLIDALSRVSTVLTNRSFIANIQKGVFPGMDIIQAMANSVNKDENKVNPLAQKEDEYYKNFDNYTSMTADFYNLSKGVYQSLVSNTNMMVSMMRGGAIGGGVMGGLGAFFPKGGNKFGNFLSNWGGPLGVGLGLAIGLVTELFAKDPVQQHIEQNTAKTADILDKQFGRNPNTQTGTGLTNLMSQSIDTILQNAQTPLDTTQGITDRLDELIRVLKTRQLETNGRAIRIGG